MVVYAGFNSKIPEIPEKIYVLAGLFIFTLTLTLHRYLVPVIHEGTLFVYTAIVWFLALGAYGETFGWPLYVFLAIPTIAIGASIVSLKKPPFVFQVLMYAWFLVCSLFLLVITWFSFAEAKNVFQLFMLGVVAFPLGVCVLSLWEFIPLPGKRQSFASRMRQWREYVAMLGTKYSEHQLPPYQAIMLLAVVWTILATNQEYGLVSDATAISSVLFALEPFGYLFLDSNTETK